MRIGDEACRLLANLQLAARVIGVHVKPHLVGEATVVEEVLV